MFPDWSVFVAEWASISAEHNFTMLPKSTWILGGVFSSFQSKTHTKYTPQTGRCILVCSHVHIEKSGGTDARTRQPLARSFGQRDASSWGASLWGEDDSRQRIWLLFHFIVSQKNSLVEKTLMNTEKAKRCRKKITKKETFLCQNCLVVFFFIAIRSWFPPGVKPPTSWCPLQTRRMWPEVLVKKWSLVTNALKSSLSRLVWPGRRWEWPGRRLVWPGRRSECQSFNIFTTPGSCPSLVVRCLYDVVWCCAFEEKVCWWVVLLKARLENLLPGLQLDFCYFVKDHDRYMKLWYENKLKLCTTWNCIQQTI